MHSRSLFSNPVT